MYSLDGAAMESPISAPVIVEEKNRQTKKRIRKSILKATESVHKSLDADPSNQINIEIGQVVATIRDVAIRNQVDYIVMGTQGENSTLDKYLGSVSSNILIDAPCPIIVIPEKTVFAKKVVIGYTTDFLDADPFVIWRVLKLFKSFQPKIKCFYFNERQEDNEAKIQDLESYLAETAPELEIECFNFTVKDKVKDINSFIDQYNINMLVMYKPARTFFKSLFHKSCTQKMARSTNIPLLVLKENK